MIKAHIGQRFFPLICELYHDTGVFFARIRVIVLAVCVGVVIGGFVTAVPVSAQMDSWTVQAVYAQPLGAAGFRSPTGLVLDPVSGELYVLDAGRHRVDVLDSAGFPRFSFAHWVNDMASGRRVLGEPHSIAITPDGEIFLTDRLSRSIDILNIRGETIGTVDILAKVGWGDLSVRPEKLGLDTLGWLYVSVSGDRTGVIRYRLDDSDCRVFIDAQAEGIELITGMAVSPDGHVMVLDQRGIPAVRVYDPDGTEVLSFSGHDVARGDLSYPCAAIFADDGTYWVLDGLRQAIKQYSAEGDFIGYVGGFGRTPGSLLYPSGLAGDGVETLYVVERVGRRVQRFIHPPALSLRGDLPGFADKQDKPVSHAPETDKVATATRNFGDPVENLHSSRVKPTLNKGGL